MFWKFLFLFYISYNYCNYDAVLKNQFILNICFIIWNSRLILVIIQSFRCCQKLECITAET